MDGLLTNYAWSPQNRLTHIVRDGRTTDNTYDGIGRLQTSTDTTTTPTPGNAGGGAGGGSGGGMVGQPTVTSSVWDGLSVLTQTNPASGTTSMVRDVTGNVAIQTSTLTIPGTGIRWNLTDAQGSPIAQTIGGAVTEQATYGDYGNQTFNTPGWNATVGFGGEITDPTNDLNSYYARQYDPVTATWLSPDPYQGSVSASQTQNRYAFVSGNPTTNTDFLGYCYQNYTTGNYIGVNCGGKPIGPGLETFTSEKSVGNAATGPVRNLTTTTTRNSPHTFPKPWPPRKATRKTTLSGATRRRPRVEATPSRAATSLLLIGPAETVLA
ncbi:hypothetical protein EH165_06540 [Nakamurella antarctica]|uniref:RHS repeat-associated core domain-containing protein n=1 Tax=Nakamurella antarctica TaxID=1902245 RepID=A0A3G8ZKY1_9ACTN|nr:RHS repeat-associated core domain-containing protein [Nakamurella antarctica]AZI57860.1 hypothetical protein EH165_06540 [Nakamurella antarctica]